MDPEDRATDRTEEAKGQEADEQPSEWHWRRPTRSDQAPGEEAVQVNDAYVGGEQIAQEEASKSGDQHPTGG